MFLLISGVAFAAPCAGLHETVEAARAAFDDAELEKAQVLLDQAQADLGCQSKPVHSEDFHALYLLKGVTALAQGDQREAKAWVVLAVTVRPDAPTPDQYGPDLAWMVRTSSSRLGDPTVEVRFDADGYVDGRRVDPVNLALTVIPGTHLLQWRADDGFHSELRDVDLDMSIRTKPEAAAPRTPAPVTTAPATEKPPVAHKNLRPALFTAGALSAVAGGTLAGIGFIDQRAISAKDYNDDAFGKCDWFEDCYGAAREDAIYADARRVSVLYVGAASLAGVSAALFGAGIAVHPTSTGISLSGRW